MIRLDRRVLALAVLALIVLSALAVNTVIDLMQLKNAAQLHVRDARHGALYATMDTSLTRVAGESASYALTQRAEYLTEAQEALATGRAALQRLRETSRTSVAPSDAQHHRFIERYSALLDMVEHGLRATLETAPATEEAERNKLLDTIYAYEPHAAALRAEMEPHREYEYTRNELAIAQSAERSTYATLAMLLVFTLFSVALIWWLRRAQLAADAAEGKSD